MSTIVTGGIDPEILVTGERITGYNCPSTVKTRKKG